MQVCVCGGGGGGGRSLHDFRFSTFVGHFLSDTLASMAVKGLNCCVFTRHVVRECFLRGLLHTVNFVVIKQGISQQVLKKTIWQMQVEHTR